MEDSDITTNARDHAQSRISPPPLRRQRSNVTSDEARPSAIPSYLGLSRRGDARRHSSAQAPVTSHRSTSSGLPSDSEQHRHSLPARNTPTMSHIGASSNFSEPKTSSKPPSKLASKSKPKCQVCMRSSNAKYDPLITCSACCRHYHDSCRKPSLGEGADAQHWRCFKCLSDEARRFSGTRPTDTHVSYASAAPSEEGVYSAVPTAHPHTKSHVPVQIDLQPANALTVERSVRKSNVTVPTCSLEKSSARPISSLQVDPQSVSNSCSDGVPHENTHKTPRFTSTSRNYTHGSEQESSRHNLPEISRRGDAIAQHSQTQSYLGRTEIPNTPSQRSSQTKEHSPNIDEGAYVLGGRRPSESGPTLIEAMSYKKPAFKTSLCPVCREHRILAKPGIAQAVCRKCLERSRNPKHNRSEIPETPVPVVRTPVSDTKQNPSSSDSEAIFSSGEHCGPVLWSQSRLLSAAPKTQLQEICLEHEDGTLSTQHAQTSIRGVDELTQVSAANTIPTGLISEMCQQQVDQADNREGDGNGEISPLSCIPGHSSSLHRVQTSPGAGHVPSPGNVTGLRQQQTAPCAPSRSSLGSAGPQSARGRLSTTSNSHKLGALALEQQYTGGDLAQIALVAANGRRTTASDIVSWTSSTFPDKPLGGSWETTVRSSLSRFDEFDRKKSEGSKVHYSFSSKEIKEACEQKYPAFLPKPSSPMQTKAACVREASKRSEGGEHARKTAEQSWQIQLKDQFAEAGTTAGQADSSAEDTNAGVSPHEVTSPTHEEAHAKPATRDIQIEQRGKNILFMPFEREHEAWLPIDSGPQEHNLVHIRLSSFEEAHASPAAPSVDSMTEGEKAQKIAQIRARPSRKRYFGEDYRLAHKRRHGLADIHDESDGAWKPPRLTHISRHTGRDMDSKLGTNDEVGEVDQPTLRQLFGLPDNMIPMNDGQTELAFRDGTLVNGKLPRPRNVYRVGKMFGGELTVRIN